MIKKLTAYFSKRINQETAKNLMTLMSSSFIASLIPIFLAPIFSRLYSPDNYGIFGVLIAWSTLVGILAYSHVPQTIMLAKTASDAFDNYKLAFVVNLLVSAITFVILGLTYFGWKLVSGVNLFDSVFLLIPLVTFLNGLTQSISIWLNRNKRYKVLSANRIIQVCVSALTQLILGFYFHNHYGIIISYIVGCMVGLCYLYYRITEIRVGITFQRGLVKGFIKEYKGLLQFSMPAELINNFSNQLPVFFLGHFGGTNAVGLFNFSNRMLSLPSSYATSAISEIFKQKASAQYNDTGSCRPLVVKTTKSLFLFLFIPFILAMIFAPDLFAFIFGERWREAGNYSRLIGILFFFKTIFSPVSYVIYIAKKFRLTFYIDVLVIVTSLLSLLIGYWLFDSIKTAIFFYACNYALLYLLTFYLSYKYSANDNQRLSE